MPKNSDAWMIYTKGQGFGWVGIIRKDDLPLSG